MASEHPTLEFYEMHLVGKLLILLLSTAAPCAALVLKFMCSARGGGGQRESLCECGAKKGAGYTFQIPLSALKNATLVVQLQLKVLLVNYYNRIQSFTCFCRN